MIINQEVLVQVTVTPEKMGELFCEMDCEQQADFFNSIAHEVISWDDPFCFQIEGMIGEKSLTDGARKIMSVLGEYSQERRP